jgi:cytochrome c-type biogenesis protein CcmH
MRPELAAALPILCIGAALIAAAAWWPLRAFARAGEKAPSARAPMLAAALGAAAAAAVYLVAGRPDLPGASHAERLRALAARNPETYSPEEALAVLSDVARRHPNDPRPLIYIGSLEAAYGRAEPAQRAFEEALRLDPESAEAMIGLGRVLVAQRQGEVTPEARQLFEQAGARAPQEFAPYFYQALAARQEGRREDARRLWRETLTRLPEGDRRRAMVQQMLAEGGAP